jgi:hypothetical protein
MAFSSQAAQNVKLGFWIGVGLLLLGLLLGLVSKILGRA